MASALLVAVGCGGPGETIGQTSSAGTFTNDEPAFDFFRSKGLTAVQAAGIVGNLDQESGVDPTAVQAGGPGRGIAQWSVGGRWDTDADDNATWYASQEGLPLLSLQLQLDFIWYELTTFPAYGLSDVQAATTVSGATVAFESGFEGCDTCDQSTRIAYAENVLAAFGSDPLDGGPSSPESGSKSDDAAAPCTVSTTGASGTCIDTTTCASGGGTSTPGYCPGSDEIQCCTRPAATVDGGESPDAGTHGHDAARGSSSASSGDKDDAAVVDAPAPVEHDAGESAMGAPPASPPRASDSSGGGGGCTAAGAPAEGWPSLAAFVALAVVRRRRGEAATSSCRRGTSPRGLRGLDCWRKVPRHEALFLSRRV